MNVSFDSRLLVGLASGLVSGLILASAGGGTLAALIVLFFISPLPVAITGLGWGWMSALVASLSAAAVLGIAIAPKTAIFHLVAIGLPVTALCYLALLHRDQPQSPMAQPPASQHPIASTSMTSASLIREWYPIGRVLGAAALMAGALAAFSLLSVATSTADLEAEIRKILDQALASQLALPKTSKPLTSQDIDNIAKLMTSNFGAASATTWLVFASLNLWLGGHVCRMSGRLTRPWPDLSTIIAPRELSFVFIVAVGLSFLPDYPGLIASGFAAAIMMVYVIVGLAVLHNVTRNSTYRPVLLFAAYAMLVLLQPISAFILAVLALAERFLPFRRKGPFDAEYPPPPPT